ncbi:MAG: sensor histidine kinase [Streptosporangiaceae bacterium]
MDARRLTAGAVLGLAAVAEVAARLTSTSTVRAGLAAAPVAHTGVSLPTALLIGAFCLAATIPAVLPRPLAAAAAVWLAAAASVILFDLVTVAGAAALLLVAYRLSWHRRRLLAVALAAPYLAMALVVAVQGRTGPAPAPGLTGTGLETRLLAVLLAAGIPVAALAAMARRASEDSRTHTAARELTEGVLAEHLARGERARIARELHDVVAHHISMIAVQAETARLTTAGLTDAGAQRFAAISATARAGLTEMRRLLGVLRDDATAGSAAADGEGGAEAGRPAPELRPQPGLPQLGELVDEVRAASACAARLIVSGQVSKLDPGVELAAYRIVQEALTNVRRHAPGAAVDVELRYAPGGVHLRIRDNGPGPAAQRAGPPDGHGLLGMRERALAAGGALRTGDAPGGGFCVEAELPATALEAATGSERAGNTR